MYMSPDFKYLLPAILDLAVDPLEEEKRRNQLVSAVLASGKPPYRGAEGARVTIVEFADFQCPFCRRQTDVLEKEILVNNESKIRFEYRHFPLSMHPWAQQAAEIAACAAQQNLGSFWIAHNYLFAHQQTMLASTLYPELRAILTQNGELDPEALDKCFRGHEQVQTVRRDAAIGRSLGVQATPTLFINGVMLPGLRSADEIRARIRKIESEVVKRKANEPLN
jgi:protein-disulfide isomerase